MVFVGDSTSFDDGTTTLEVARSLKEKHKFPAITASLPIANEITFTFSLGSGEYHILTGGFMHPGKFSLEGHIPEISYSNLHVNKTTIGVGCLSIQDGLT
jgi:DeoR/GlpR family transcriptional regulator of sugar metabolism